MGIGFLCGSDAHCMARGTGMPRRRFPALREAQPRHAQFRSFLAACSVCSKTAR